jgi:integrase
MIDAAKRTSTSDLMEAAMPRPRPPFLHRQVERGKTFWYVRRHHGTRTRIRAPFGSDEFWREYEAACAGRGSKQLLQTRNNYETAPLGSLAWLIERYRETSAWTDLSLATRRQRENIFKKILEGAGQKPYAKITSETIEAGCARRKDTPAQARHFLDTLRGCFRWAKKAKLVKLDPTADVDTPKQKKSAGFAVWSDDDVVAYQRRWPLGTRERVWLDVGLYTGLRRGDAVRLGRQHVRDGVITLKTEKTGTEVTIPILPELAATLAAGPCGDLHLIVGASGKPFTKESFGNEFRKACRKAGIRGKPFHGLRKLAATRLANAGATGHMLDAFFGWSGGRTAAIYTRGADRRRLGVEAGQLLIDDLDVLEDLDEVLRKRPARC